MSMAFAWRKGAGPNAEFDIAGFVGESSVLQKQSHHRTTHGASCAIRGEPAGNLNCAPQWSLHSMELSAATLVVFPKSVYLNAIGAWIRSSSQ